MKLFNKVKGKWERWNSIEGAANVATSKDSIWSYGTWPADRHDPNAGAGTTAGDMHFSTTDQSNFNEHIITVTAGASGVTLTVKPDSASTATNVFVEDMLNVAAGTMVTGVALPVGMYKLRGKFKNITMTQVGTETASSEMISYVK